MSFKIKEVFKEIFISVFRPFKGIFTILALLVITVACSLLIITPLWYFATTYRQAYTYFALSLIGLGAILFIILRIKKIMLEVKQNRTEPSSGTIRLIQVLFSTVSLTMFLWLFLLRNFLFALLILACYFIGLGIIKYVSKRTRQQYNH